MRLLLDTHIALWAITDSPRLSGPARDYILAADNEIYLSVASVWEIAIKHALGRERMPLSAAEAASYFNQAGYLSLPVTQEHAIQVAALPDIHTDPFDRIMVAQAICEPLHLLTHDQTLSAYSDLVILC